MIMVSISGVFLAGICSAQIQPPGNESPPENASYFAVLGSTSIPVGDFAKVKGANSGNAQLGGGFGLVKSFPLNRKVSFLLEGRFMYNRYISPIEEFFSIAESSGYLTIWGLSGIEINKFTSTGNRLYLKGLMGFCYGKSPGIEHIFGKNNLQLFKDSRAFAFSYGLGAGLGITENFILEAAFITSTPEYRFENELTAETVKAKIDHSIFAVSVGFLF